MGDWKAWGTCSRSCGGGITTKAREVLQEAKHGGVVCPILEETAECNTMPMPRYPVSIFIYHNANLLAKRMIKFAQIKLTSVYKSLSCLVLGGTQTSALKPVGRASFWSKGPSLIPVPAFHQQNTKY